MSQTNESSEPGNQASPLMGDVPGLTFTLRDLYVRASISGDSMAAELGRYLNIDENTFASSSPGNAESRVSDCELGVHEQALAAILEVVASNSRAATDYLSSPEPPGGIREWWTRMLSGSMNDSESDTKSSKAVDFPESWRAHPSFGSSHI